ncbi:hypothetical protein K469DRAFT_692238 [Zopfia rhizophila CBS 207.26]|uniref:Uncharacterized protein n=1 Tax=Zopfia rhizophila CBS 207.26 TaxID=1314779 RepID=A0A6A6DSN7_9PEZI|nr:hypothetical protein K469DRAFT_692238 [Zopfia rhizophila CBS 207.26]
MDHWKITAQRRKNYLDRNGRPPIRAIRGVNIRSQDTQNTEDNRSGRRPYSEKIKASPQTHREKSKPTDKNKDKPGGTSKTDVAVEEGNGQEGKKPSKDRGSSDDEEQAKEMLQQILELAKKDAG